MNPHPQKSNQLLEEVLSVEETDSLKSRSLDLMLVASRQRRQMRVASQVAVCMLLPLLLSLVFLTPSKVAPPPREAIQILSQVEPPPRPADVIPRPAAKAAATTRILSDEELLAMFPDRPVALIGSPGNQRLILFDEPLDQADF